MRILLWLLFAVALAGGALWLGLTSARDHTFPATWFLDAPPQPAPTTPVEAETPGAKKATDVLSLPYLRGKRGSTADRPKGVTINAVGGGDYNLVCSGHAPEALLIDMAGNVVHRWKRPFDDIESWTGKTGWHWRWPPRILLGWTCFRRAYLRPGGDLLVIFEDLGLVCLDKDSNVKWAFRGGRPHHGLDVGPDGTIYVLSRTHHHRDDLGLITFTPDDRVFEDFVFVLSPDGELQKEVSILEAIRRSPYAPSLELVKSNDMHHTNSIHLVPESVTPRGPVRPGQILLSMRNINAVGALDLESERMSWMLFGAFAMQHEVTAVPSGNLLLFDNRGDGGASRVLEIDPMRLDPVWRYPGPDRDDDLYSETCGTCHRLPGGNTLIVESENGRALEVTRAGEIVWEYHSPYLVDGDKIAMLYDVIRVPQAAIDFPLD